MLWYIVQVYLYSVGASMCVFFWFWRNFLHEAVLRLRVHVYKSDGHKQKERTDSRQERRLYDHAHQLFFLSPLSVFFLRSSSTGGTKYKMMGGTEWKDLQSIKKREEGRGEVRKHTAPSWEPWGEYESEKNKARRSEQLTEDPKHPLGFVWDVHYYSAHHRHSQQTDKAALHNTEPGSCWTLCAKASESEKQLSWTYSLSWKQTRPVCVCVL